MKKEICLFVLLAGCAATETVWNKPGASTQDFNMDAGQCKAQAFGAPGAINAAAQVNAMQVAVIYSSCMQGKGWYTVEREARRSNAPQDRNAYCADIAERISKTKDASNETYKYQMTTCIGQ